MHGGVSFTHTTMHVTLCLNLGHFPLPARPVRLLSRGTRPDSAGPAACAIPPSRP